MGLVYISNTGRIGWETRHSTGLYRAEKAGSEFSCSAILSNLPRWNFEQVCLYDTLWSAGTDRKLGAGAQRRTASWFPERL